MSVMNTFVRSIVLAGACLAGASGLMAQPGQTQSKGTATPQVDISHQDQFMQRKQGQYTAETEARLREAREGAAYRAEQGPAYTPEAYIDTWLRVKQGQATAETETRLRDARESAAYRAEQQPPATPESYIDAWLRVKQGVVR
jgi:hypothetical protein